MHHIAVSRWGRSRDLALVRFRLTHQDWGLEVTSYCKDAGLILSTEEYDDPYWWMILDSPAKLEGLQFLIETYRPVIYDPESLLPPMPTDADARTVAVLVEERRGRLRAHVRTSNFQDVMHEVEAMPNSSAIHDTRGTYVVPVIPHVTEEPLRRFVTRWGADLFDLDDVLGLRESVSTDIKEVDPRSTSADPRSSHDPHYDAKETSLPAW